MFDDATTRLLRAGSLAQISSRPVTITVTDGPNRGAKLRVEDLAHRQLLVGKAPACDLRLADPAASRRHLSLELDERGLVVRDLDSSNGTEVEGVLVREAILRGGEHVRVGGTTLVVELDADAHVVPAPAASHFGGFVGASPAARRLYPALERLAQTDDAVLFEGEPSTGRELLAASLHDASARKDNPFVAFERGAASSAEAEEALFGRGDVPGLLERASGGTLFVHEIGELDAALQVKLLDALERRAVRRIGAVDATRIDVRVLASTSRDLDRDVQDRRFREDLLDFVSKARIVVPPLRRRRSDIAALAQLFWSRFGGADGGLSPALVQELELRSWPGNVGELARTIAERVSDASRSVATGPAPSGEPPQDIVAAVLARDLAFTRAREIVLGDFEQRYLDHMLRLHKGNVSRAAAASGISRRYFYRLRTRE